MAERKEPKEISSQGRRPGKEMSEKSPNPHGESKILQMPIRTQQSNETSGKNIPKVPNTIGGNLNPSADKRPRTAKPVKEFKRKDA